jgi:hypothetical protein
MMLGLFRCVLVFEREVIDMVWSIDVWYAEVIIAISCPRFTLLRVVIAHDHPAKRVASHFPPERT